MKKKTEEFIGKVPNKTTKKRIKILKLLSDQSLTLSQICSMVGYSSEKALYSFIRRAKQYGLLTNDSNPTMRHMTTAGQQYVKSFFSFGVHTPKNEEKNEELEPDILRHHAVQFSVSPIGCTNWPGSRFISDIHVRKYGLSSLRRWKKDKAEIVDFWISDVRIQTNNRGLEIFIPDMFYKDPKIMVDTAYTIVLDVLPTLERMFQVKFYKPNRMNIRLSKQEVAVLNNELAYFLKEKGITYLVVHDLNGKPWAKFDYSKGPPEFEFIDSKEADYDTERFKDFCNDIRKKRTFLPSESSRLIREIKLLSESVIELSMNLAKLTMENKKNIKEIKETIKQPKLPEPKGAMYG